MKYLIYSTSRSSYYQTEANKAALWLSQSKGRDVQIDVVYKKLPKKIVIFKDKDNDVRLSWDWFNETFDLKDYDGVGFHFAKSYKKKWKLTVSGSKNSFNKSYPQFFFSCDKEKAPGYPDSISNFVRLLIHEISHFDEDLDNDSGNVLTQDSVHTWDYKFKAIHHYPRFVDYRGYIIKRRAKKLLEKTIQYAKTIIKAIQTTD